ncbi:glycylpeptide N-tetradecanoyltransferase 1-like [Lampris incognitus]|uniref:glycylpeptide N-tetradecanoyltransferase 1-like n=1 Tax=Lampris incognitus TaxID=2546036 RepID=UPI0024B59463|nr:glycylpeptide N-tetradecanoyltransferase 1-like [Lampris incognitus]
MADSNMHDKSLTEEDGGRLKKNKKKQKKEAAWKPEGPRDPVAMLNSLPEEKQQEIQKTLHLFSLGQSLPKTLQEAKHYTHRFWDTQPVPKLSDTVTTEGPIVEVGEGVREEPYSLPQGFSWDTLDPTSPTTLRELCTLLNENYTEDDDNTIRSHFSPEYLQWVLQPPGWVAQWHCGVRVHTSKKLVGFIAAVPANVRIYDKEKQMAQVSLLCVHKKLRFKRMSPVLIRELTRRVNRQGLYQAVYTVSSFLPTPLSTCRYWQRSLNPRKLMEVTRSGLGRNMTVQRALKLNRLPEATKTSGLRPMTKEDVPAVRALLERHLQKFHLAPLMSPQDAQHWLMPRDGVIDTYVVQSAGGLLTDLVSFYCVAYQVLNHPVHSALRVAHLLYCVCTSTDLASLMEDALVLAKAKGFDAVTVLDVMENKCFMEKLKFTRGDKNLHYYLYNWACPTISPDKVGLLLPY